MVSQNYVTRVHEEDVILGNSGILSCVIPSFVADFVSVQAWNDNTGKIFYTNENYGNFNANHTINSRYSLFKVIFK